MIHKHLTTRAFIIALILCFSPFVNAQNFLGKTYEEIIDLCKTENVEIEETINEESRVQIAVPFFDNNTGEVLEIHNLIFTNSKTKKERRICDIEQIVAPYTEYRLEMLGNYLGEKGYENTNYKSSIFDVYKSQKNGNHPLEHYMSLQYIESGDDAFILLEYYLTTIDFTINDD